MWYELWAGESGNLLADFDNEGAALAATREYLRVDGLGGPVDVVLVVYGDDERPVRSVHGADLAAMVPAEERRPTPRSA